MKLRWALAISATVVLLDQLTKAWLVAALPYGSAREIISGLFRLVHTRNRGVAFGLLGSASPTVHTVLLLVVIAVVLVLTYQLHRSGSDGGASVGLALVLGGAIGNLVDRIVRGEVVDFLDFFIAAGCKEYHWPAFNVADSAITVGAFLVILVELIRGVRQKRDSGTA